ncbi:MAG TPA: tRNA (N(6)-L-threonylcarbamoyladenosine(37)-C(2))-methylthiotransferase MtaB [Fervidobacterium sp.]|nr:tRNA (N(6)-L-threonylcarbamoyladenosine(37)-C(2))-methylthiotransferase MtaB [Fervidobacterium sp.]HPT53894.1 tRNA (N(6)-L-threonylcarbamoyladenosine(37)-C(2))-methylthiotransferase MtaB [Fervidobacterium sp.]
MRISVITQGCKMNQYESELIIEMLENAGYVVVTDEDPLSDIYIVNSCAVTSEAERKVRQIVRHLRRGNSKAKIILAGCYAQMPRKGLEGEVLDVDLVLGNLEKKQILSFLDESGVHADSDYWKEDNISFELVENSVEDRSRAFVKVEDGCNNGCTYCVIRSLRGTRIRSKPEEVVLKEIERLVAKKHREIVITGLNLGKYGIDMEGKGNLASLLMKILKMRGDFRIRLSSINPEDLTDELIKIIGNEERICSHLHIPLQSGSTTVLKRMGRNYSVEEFMEKIEKLRALDPLFSITTDIMVGFPGESEGEFEETLELVKNAEFSKVHTFRFSERSGTRAAEFEDQISGNVRKERAELLIKYARNAAHYYREKLIGQNANVLVEGVSNGIYVGYDEYYVYHEINSGALGEFARVKVYSVTEEGVVSKVDQKQVSNE